MMMSAYDKKVYIVVAKELIDNSFLPFSVGGFARSKMNENWFDKSHAILPEAELCLVQNIDEGFPVILCTKAFLLTEKPSPKKYNFPVYIESMSLEEFIRPKKTKKFSVITKGNYIPFAKFLQDLDENQISEIDEIYDNCSFQGVCMELID